MDSFLAKNFGKYWTRANQWFYRTADRALDEAYKAALKIKAIEDEHFNGQSSFPLNTATSKSPPIFRTISISISILRGFA
jgi:hypothetical protein